MYEVWERKEDPAKEAEDSDATEADVKPTAYGVPHTKEGVQKE